MRCVTLATGAPSAGLNRFRFQGSPAEDRVSRLSARAPDSPASGPMVPPATMRMTTRDEAIRLLEDQHAEVAALLAELSTSAFERRGTIGGGEWSAKDLAAHLGAWEGVRARGARSVRPRRATRSDSSSTNDDRLNAREERRFLDAPADEVLARFEDLHRSVVGVIGSMSDDGWMLQLPVQPGRRDDRRPGGLARLGRRPVPPRTSAHLPDLRDYVIDQPLKVREPQASAWLHERPVDPERELHRGAGSASTAPPSR